MAKLRKIKRNAKRNEEKNVSLHIGGRHMGPVA
jgi:hypothetical protein